MQHGHVGLIVRYHFVSRLVSASHVETPALIRDQLQVRLDNYRVEVLDTSVVLRTKIRVITDANKFPSPPLFSIILYIARGETKAFFRTFLRRVSTRSIIQLRKSGIEAVENGFCAPLGEKKRWERFKSGSFNLEDEDRSHRESSDENPSQKRSGVIEQTLVFILNETIKTFTC